jgi:hypothetical protein
MSNTLQAQIAGRAKEEGVSLKPSALDENDPFLPEVSDPLNAAPTSSASRRKGLAISSLPQAGCLGQVS